MTLRSPRKPARETPSLRNAGDGRQRGRASTTTDLQRAAFLRRCRDRISPEEVGLGKHRLSRSGGLRREDVAAISGVSVSWYTWLEQGRRMRVSDEMLDRICRALGLTDDERTYLYSLVQKRPPPQTSSKLPLVAPLEVVELVEALTLPAVAFNLGWDILAWNAQAAALYEDYGKLPADQRNLLEIVFSRPPPQPMTEQYDRMVYWLVSRTRFDFSRCLGDARFEALTHRLCATSPLFRRLWTMPEFTLRAYGHNAYVHHRFGSLSFRHTSFSPDGHPKISVTICVPENAVTRRALAKVNEELLRDAKSVSEHSGPPPARNANELQSFSDKPTKKRRPSRS